MSGGGGGGGGPSGSVAGLQAYYLSAATIGVRAGSASAGSSLVTIASDKVLDLSDLGLNGLDRKTLTGTCARTSGSKTVTGTGTAFLSEFGVRAIGGTAGTGGSSSTTLTGVGTRFRRLAVGDLIGTAASGFRRILRIASDTSITLASAITLADGTTVSVIEQPTLQVGVDKAHVDKIDSNTSLALLTNATETASGTTAYTGVIPTATGQTSQTWLWIWAITDGSTPGVCASTQRTSLLSPPAGYSTAVVVGVVPAGVGGDVFAFSQERTGPRAVRHHYLAALDTDGGNGERVGRVVNGVTQFTPTQADLSGNVPAGSVAFDAEVQVNGGYLVLARTAADGCPHYALHLTTPRVPCAGQEFGWSIANSGTAFYCDLIGFEVDLGGAA